MFLFSYKISKLYISELSESIFEEGFPFLIFRFKIIRSFSLYFKSQKTRTMSEKKLSGLLFVFIPK